MHESNPSSPHAFPRSARLLNGHDFQRVFDDAVRSRDGGFTVLARRREGVDSGCSARLGLAIAKRQIRSAARRNRVKRRIRESFRHHQCELAGIDVIVMAKHGVDAWTGETMSASLARHWRRIASRCDGDGRRDK